MLLAKIKGNKDYFGKLVTFLEGGGSIYSLPTPLDPLEGVSRGVTCSKIFHEGWTAQI